jgi:hypothetical protein
MKRQGNGSRDISSWWWRLASRLDLDHRRLCRIDMTKDDEVVAAPLHNINLIAND